MASAYKTLHDIRTGKVSKDGTKMAGFVTAEENKPPRECGNCRWMKEGTCRHKVVNADPELQDKKLDGFVQVDKDDCCDFFQNKK